MNILMWVWMGGLLNNEQFNVGLDGGLLNNEQFNVGSGWGGGGGYRIMNSLMWVWMGGGGVTE